MEEKIGDLTLIKPIGEGLFGSIFLAVNNENSTKYAVKLIKSKHIENPIDKKYIDNEISILKDINHPNILKVIDIKEKLNNIYIITEYYNGGNLLEIMENNINKQFSEETVQYIMKQIIEGMKYLWNKKIMHRHISLDNIMINYEDENDKITNNILKGKIKIIDFGYARYLKKGELSNTIIGTPLYMSPIILNKLNEQQNYNDIKYDKKEDIWSLGCICYELLIGYSPFETDNMEVLLGKVNKGDYYVPITLSKEAVSFLNCMLQFERNNRLSVDALYNHKFLRKNVKEFNKIDINELKNIEIINNSKIKINTNNNKEIFENFGNGL